MSFHYSDAVREFKKGRKSNEYKKLANATYLYKRTDNAGVERYEVKLYSTTVVTIYPDHQRITNGGWVSQVTCKIIKQFSCLSGHIGGYSKCGFEDTFRINGLPFFDGIRIDNTGEVFRQDRRSDWKREIRKEAVTAWKALHMPLTKALRGRFDLGEFDEVRYIGSGVYNKGLQILTDMDRQFPAHEDVVGIIALTPRGHRPRGYRAVSTVRTPMERWVLALGELRLDYYRKNDAYMRIEVPNV